MTINELPDADLSRWIAEKMEPMPDYTPTITGAIGGLIVMTDHASVTEAWMFRFGQQQGPNAYCWLPRDMVNDPAMTVMLIGLLSDRNLVIRRAEDHKEWVVYFWEDRVNNSVPIAKTIHSGNLGRAVAEGFALANGWKE